MKRITKLLGAGIVTLCSMVYALVPSEAEGAVPQLINFQGQLKDGSGNPVPTGNYSLAVKIYDVPSGPNPPLWSDNFTVATSGGLFTINLGSGAPLPASLFSNPNLWVGVAVGGDPEATPRTQLTSVPYSARVGTVDGATGGVISGDVSIQSNLTVSDTIKSTSGGVEFPDGSVQTTATLMPIGGVIAWLKSFPNTPALPGNFAECNGQVLNDPQSPYNGQTIPNLNSANRFLQGGTSSGTTGGTTTHDHPHVHDLFTETERLRGTFDADELHVTLFKTNNVTPTSPPSSHLPPYYAVVWIMRVK